MQPSLPRQAFHVVLRLRRSKHRTKRVMSQTSSEDVHEATQTPTPTDNEICVLDDNFAERYQEQVRDDRPKRPEKKPVMLRFGGGRKTLSHYRNQFMVWKGQAASNAAKTLRGCYTLARRELTSWRRHTKPEQEEKSSQTKASPHHRVANPRTPSHTSTASSVSIVSSLSSTTELEEERRKEQYRSDFSLPVHRTSSLEMKPSFSGFAETTSGSHECLLLVNTLSLNDSDEEDGEDSLLSHHLPFRTTMVNGHVHILKNEWV